MTNFGKIYIPRIKFDKKRIIKFLAIWGFLLVVDRIFDVTSIFNRYILAMISLMFGIKANVIDFHSSLPISIAVIWSSKFKLTKKLEFSASLVIIYAWIFAITTAIGIIYPSLEFYVNIIVLITLSFPIILWILSY